MEGQRRGRDGVTIICIPHERTGAGQEAQKHNGSVIPISTSYRLISFTNSVEGGRATREENM